jgi:hypothetical protein
VATSKKDQLKELMLWEALGKPDPRIFQTVLIYWALQSKPKPEDFDMSWMETRDRVLLTRKTRRWAKLYDEGFDNKFEKKRLLQEEKQEQRRQKLIEKSKKLKNKKVKPKKSKLALLRARKKAQRKRVADELLSLAQKEGIELEDITSRGLTKKRTELAVFDILQKIKDQAS